DEAHAILDPVPTQMPADTEPDGLRLQTHQREEKAHDNSTDDKPPAEPIGGIVRQGEYSPGRHDGNPDGKPLSNILEQVAPIRHLFTHRGAEEVEETGRGHRKDCCQRESLLDADDSNPPESVFNSKDREDHGRAEPKAGGDTAPALPRQR